jgi:enamine deaminase RidA (YjgF/YER057c/UK114 family)
MAPPPSTTTSPSGTKQYYTTHNPFEARFGYHRAVRKGPFIFVSGTTALDPSTGKLQHPGNAEVQAMATFKEALRAVIALGGDSGDVIRVRMFVARKEDTEGVGEAFAAFFKGRGETEVGTAATMIVVGGFVDEEMLVEIEMDAVVS